MKLVYGWIYVYAIVQYAVVTILIHVCLCFDIGSIQSFVNTPHFVVKTFSFERGKVSLWHCCAKLVKEVPWRSHFIIIIALNLDMYVR